MSKRLSALLSVTIFVLSACGGGEHETSTSQTAAVSPAPPFGTLTIAGVTVPRIAPPPVAPPDQSAVDSFMSGFTAGAVTDFGTQAAADAAVGLALTGPNGSPVRLGKVAYVRPGLGNIMFSPAQIFLLAQHFDTVVLLYTNTTDTANPTALRAVTEVAGVHVPTAIADRVRIFAIGSPALNLISFQQQSDVTIEQLEQLRAGRALLGFNPINVGAWLFAHSQGVNDANITEQRLRKAGLPGFGRIIGVAGAVKGGRLIGTDLGVSFVDGAFAVAGDQGRNAMLALEPPTTIASLITLLDIHGADVERKLLRRLEQRTFAAFGGIVDPNQPQGNVRASFIFLAGVADYAGQITPNDGVENLDSTTLGRHTATFNQADHILMTEDPAILQQELQVLRPYAD